MSTPGPSNLSAQPQPAIKRSLAPSPNLEPHNIASETSLQSLAKARSSASAQTSQVGSPAPGSRDRSKDTRGRSNSAVTKESTKQSPSGNASRTSKDGGRTGSRGQGGAVRTLPPWIDSVEFPIPSITLSDSASSPLLSQPPRAVPPQHHFDSTKPSNKASSSNPKPVPQPPKLNRRMSKDGYQSESDDESTALQPAPSSGLFGREPNRGRKWDHARQGDPVIMQSHFAGANKYTRPSTAPNRQARYSDGIEDAAGASEWSTFVKSSMYGPVRGEQNERVQPSYLDELTPGYSQPWVGDRVGASQDPEKALGLLRGSKKKRLVWYQRAQRSILTHPLVPLAFRLTVLATSTIALGLSASIFVLTRQTQFAQTPSAVMAIIVDVIALPYIGYITWDEYTGKPLGLRPPKAKMRLVLLDLFFIIFESANLSLAFQAITDTDGSCVRGEGARGEIDGNLCGQEKALAGILFVALVAWGSTFAVSIVRLVQRVGGREEGD